MNLYDTNACVNLAVELALTAIRNGDKTFFKSELGRSICECLNREGAIEKAIYKTEERRAQLRKRIYQMELWEDE